MSDYEGELLVRIAELEKRLADETEGNDLLRTENESALMQLTEARKQLADEKRLNQRTYCAYCGAEFPIDDPNSPEAVSAHIRTCEKHPMRVLEQLYEASQKQLAAQAEDASVGRILRTLPPDTTIDVNLASYGAEVVFCGKSPTKVYQGESVRDALIAAGLLPEKVVTG